MLSCYCCYVIKTNIIQIVVKQCQADVSFDKQIVQCKQQKFNTHFKYICLCFDDKKVGKPRLMIKFQQVRYDVR